MGDDRADAGRVWVRGQPVALRSVTENVRRWRVGYVSEDRKEEGLLLDFPVLANLTLTVWERLVNRWTRRIDPVRERGLGRHWVDALGIQCGSLENPVRNLSGGNQQKICLARWLAADCEILIIDEPTVGVDLGAKEQIHQVIRDLAAREGKAILLISSDMPEMIQLAHRILVFRDRRIVGEVVGGGASGQSAAEIGEAIGHWLN
ncbi:MAG: ATP-binding cassette domain-containing protein [Verrucomicrobia bacterium]|nr:ATP-binding cassette domain-containing protein [Verrucomicrobiota bacterium]